MSLKNNQPKSNGGAPRGARPTAAPNKIEAKNNSRAKIKPAKPARANKPAKVVKSSDRTKPSKAAKPAGAGTIELPNNDGRTDREAIAFAMVKPSLRHGQLAGELGHLMVAQLPEAQRPGIAEYRKEAFKQIVEAQNGDLTIASQLLAAQALSLDAIFTELARRSAINLSQHLDAAERYMRMVLKAQSGCRATLDALARLHSPREQTVRHVHLDNRGGQAVVAEEFHHHAGTPPDENPKGGKQPHEQGTRRTTLPGPDAARDAMPVPGNPDEETLSASRRSVDRGANG